MLGREEIPRSNDKPVEPVVVQDTKPEPIAEPEPEIEHIRDTSTLLVKEPVVVKETLKVERDYSDPSEPLPEIKEVVEKMEKTAPTVITPKEVNPKVEGIIDVGAGLDLSLATDCMICNRPFIMDWQHKDWLICPECRKRIKKLIYGD